MARTCISGSEQENNGDLRTESFCTWSHWSWLMEQHYENLSKSWFCTSVDSQIVLRVRENWPQHCLDLMWLLLDPRGIPALLISHNFNHIFIANASTYPPEIFDWLYLTCLNSCYRVIIGFMAWHKVQCAFSQFVYNNYAI